MSKEFVFAVVMPALLVALGGLAVWRMGRAVRRMDREQHGAVGE